MAGITAPDNFPIRNAKSRPQNVGRIINPAGWYGIGGITPSKWPAGNTMRVEKPTDVRAAHKSTRKDVE